MIIILVIVLFLVCSWKLYALVSVKTSFPKKHAYQRHLQNKFKEFISSNLAVEIDDISIQRFMNDTSDIAIYFQSNEIINTRLSLQDNAHTLLGLNNRAGHPNQSPDSKAEVTGMKKETLVWFKGVGNRIDGMFEPEMKLRPSPSDVWLRMLEIIRV